MEFNVYQEEAQKTIQRSVSDEKLTDIIPFLGIIGEVGSVVTQLKKKIRDGDSYLAFANQLSEELGDVLWYISAIATQHNLTLDDIANQNLKKTHDRFLSNDSSDYKDFDIAYPEEERFPDEFEVEFVSFEDDGKKKLKIIDKRSNTIIGNTLTDNNYEDDGYRFHDVFHYGYLAILGWSPVMRKLLELKRKSNADTDENEDGARAYITEELITLFIYHYAVDHDLLKRSTRIDTDVIKMIQKLAVNTEVKECSGKQWEEVIHVSYNIFNQLRQNEGGRVLVSKKNRSLTYIGKNS